MLSQHVRKTGNPIRSLDLKLSCDIKVVPTARACADRQTGYKRRKLVQNHMIVRSHADSAQPSIPTLDIREGSREGLGPRLRLP